MPNYLSEVSENIEKQQLIPGAKMYMLAAWTV
jgi:hypothetical protein